MKTLKIQLILFGILLLAQNIYAQDKVKIACIGNSITYGYGLSNPTKDCYPAQLQDLLNEKFPDACEVRNFSYSGRTMLKNGDYPLWDEQVFSNAIAYQADIVVILLGSNDSKPQNWNSFSSEFYGDYISMIEEFQASNSSISIFACIPPPAFGEVVGITNNVIVNGVIPEIKKVIENTVAIEIDFYSVFDGKPGYFPDKVHPNKAGAGIIAETVYTIFEEKNIIQPSNSDSTDTNDYKYLKKGWNLVACTLKDSTDVEVAFSNIWVSFESVKTLNDFYTKGYMSELNCLTKMKFGQGYFIKVNEDCILDW